MRPRRYFVRFSIIPVAVSSVVGLGASPAVATDEDGFSLRRYTATAIAAATRPAALAEGKSAERVRAYLEEAAREGRLVDVARVRVATLRDPAAGQIDLIWDDLAEPQYVGVTDRTDGADAGQTGVGVVFAERESAVPGTPTAAGLGYEAGYNLRGMYQYGNTGCRTVRFDPKYSSSSDHWTTTCYQKFAQSGTNRWIYNRWALWNRAKPDSGTRAENVDFTTRSRPWAGHEYKVVALDGWTPAAGTSQCAETLSYDLHVTSGVSVTIPLHRCSVTTVLPEANKRSMGMDWNGRSQNQLYEDYGMAIRADSTATVPIFADYLWAEVQYCGNVAGASCAGGPSQYLVEKDSGWSSTNSANGPRPRVVNFQVATAGNGSGGRGDALYVAGPVSPGAAGELAESAP